MQPTKWTLLFEMNMLAFGGIQHENGFKHLTYQFIGHQLVDATHGVALILICNRKPI